MLAFVTMQTLLSVVFFLSGKVDPMGKMSTGTTPVELGHSYEIVSFFDPFEQCHEIYISFPVES